MKSKKILTLIFAVLLVFSLFGCGKKEPVADVEPQDTVEQEKLPPIVTEKNTPKQEPVELTQEELHALFKKEYDTERYAKSNLYADQYKDFYMKLPAREIGTQVDANVYSYIESAVKGAEYEGKVLPDDGFEQYVEWREALEKGSSSGTNQSVNNSGNTGNAGNTGSETQKPSGGSSNNGGSYDNTRYYDNVYEGATVEREVPDNSDFGERGEEQEYEKPSYEIIG